MNTQNMQYRDNNDRLWPILRPVVIYFVIQLAVTFFVGQLGLVISMGNYRTGMGMQGLFEAYSAILASKTAAMFRYIIFAGIAMPVFIIMYRNIILKPNKITMASQLALHRKLSYKAIIAAVLLVAGLAIGMNYVVDFIASISPEAYVQFRNQDLHIGFNSWSPYNVVGLIYTIVAAPIIEELVFRGITFGLCEKKMKFWTANILVAVLFAIIHDDLIKGLVAGLFSICMTYVYFATESIVVPILCHIIYNIVATLDIVTTPTNNMATYFIVFLLSGVGVYLGLWLFKKSPKVICEKEK